MFVGVGAGVVCWVLVGVGVYVVSLVVGLLFLRLCQQRTRRGGVDLWSGIISCTFRFPFFNEE